MEKQGKSRKATPRSRLGCNSCKLRRVKCGEERPKCARCVKAGIECTGRKEAPSGSNAFYTFAIRPSPDEARQRKNLSALNQRGSELTGQTRSSNGLSTLTSSFGEGSVVRQQVLPCSFCRTNLILCNGSHPACFHRRWEPPGSYSPTRSSEVAISPTHSSVSMQMPGDANDRQLVDYFCAETFDDVCCYFSPSFWMEVVLPFSYNEPVVRYATTALSAFHKEYVVSVGNPAALGDLSRGSFTYQYSRAIQSLQAFMTNKTKPSNRMVLVCCVIFYCIEVSREQFVNAERHAKAGCQVLREWRKNLYKEPSSNLNSGPLHDIISFEEVFGGLDALFSNAHDEKPYLVLTSTDVREGRMSHIPQAFEGVEHVRTIYNYLENWVSHFMFSSLPYLHSHPDDIPPPLLREHSVLRAELDRWDRPFAVVLQAQEPNIASMGSGQSRALIRKILWLAMRTKFQVMTAHFTYGTPWLNMDSDFAEILTAAESLTAGLILQSPGKQKLRSFLLRIGYSSTLYIVAVLCTDDLIRRRAIFLLESWDGAQAGDALRRAFTEARPVNDGSPMTAAQIEQYRKLAFAAANSSYLGVFVPANFSDKATAFGLYAPQARKSKWVVNFPQGYGTGRNRHNHLNYV